MQVEHLLRRAEAIVGVDDVHVEGIDVVAHAALVRVRLLGRLALLLEKLLPFLWGCHDPAVDADVGGRVAGLLVGGVAVDVALRDGFGVVDLAVVPVDKVLGSWRVG